jgi:sulfate/thiosulfate transport system substrate-binding protein
MTSARLTSRADRGARRTTSLRRGVAPVLGALTVCGTLTGLAVPAGAAGGTVNLVAYSTPKAAYAAEIAAFNATPAGQGVTFSQSFGSSGTQASDVIAGLPADIVNFSTGLDMAKVATAGLVSASWDKNATKGNVTNSIVSFIVRKGNPLHIKTWADLVKSNAQVVTPNPFSSGSAKWNLLAGYGAQLAQGKSKTQAAAYLASLLKHTVSQPDSASDALQAFLAGQGNVLLDYQDDADYAVSQGSAITVVTPPQSILIQNPIALTTSGSKNPAAKAFLAFLLSPAGQKVWAKQSYQPVVASVAKKFHFPTPKKVFTIDTFGGWTKANVTFFDPTNGIVGKIEAGLGVSTAGV